MRSHKQFIKRVYKIKNMETLTQEQAIGVLIQAAQIAQSKGAYTLEDAEIISRAIKVFKKETKETEETQSENQSQISES